MSEADDAVEEFRFAQGGAVAHLEAMAQVARDAAEDALLRSEPMTTRMRAQAQRFREEAERCEALHILVSLVNLTAVEGSE